MPHVLLTRASDNSKHESTGKEQQTCKQKQYETYLYVDRYMKTFTRIKTMEHRLLMVQKV